MDSGLGSLILRLLPTPSARPAAPSRYRRLAAEPLEGRFALSTLADGTIVPDAPVTASDPATVLAPDSGQSTTETPIASPSDPPPPDPSPVVPNAPPEIHDFQWSMDGEMCVLSGWVSDDQVAAGYTVYFSGLISAQIIVGEDFHFSYSFHAGPDFHGEIFAQTYDLFGLESNEVSVTV